MEIEFILYVANQEKSKNFYSALLNKKPSLDVPGMTEFLLGEETKLGLMPENGIHKILADKTPHPANGNGIPRCELYLKTENLNTHYQNAIKAGAKIISEPTPRDWGDKVVYVADPDGHIIAFAEKL
ncbi:MAG: VOC family protein [Sphingobacteriaceae bacterium]|nr:VOC family protein [Sphingobacteriaceae bacterium]